MLTFQCIAVYVLAKNYYVFCFFCSRPIVFMLCPTVAVLWYNVLRVCYLCFDLVDSMFLLLA